MDTAQEKRTGETPICRPHTIVPPQWKTRNHPEAKRDGWFYAGTGNGFSKFLWDNPRFEGVPRLDGRGGPWNYRPGATGCPVPGSVRWIGEYYPGPKLSQGIKFQMALPVGAGIARLFINDKLVAGHQTDEWALENGLLDDDPRVRAIVGRVVFAGPGGHWLEIFTPHMDLPQDRPSRVVYEYAVSSGEGAFGSKNMSVSLGRDEEADKEYTWMEILSEDFCYADHVMAHPQKVKRGEPVLLSWCTTDGGEVRLNGKTVSQEGTETVYPDQSTTYEFELGGQTIARTVEVH